VFASSAIGVGVFSKANQGLFKDHSR